MNTYSFTQISHYLGCPKRYEYRYVEGWREKPARAALHFGRAFEVALEALFLEEDPAAKFFEEWKAIAELPLEYPHGDDWDSMARQAISLLEQFARDDRVRVRNPRRNLQLKILRQLAPSGKKFLAYIDAIGRMDGVRSVIDWKTTTSRYPTEPEGLLSLDPQLLCYAWLTGIANVGLVVFVRKRHPEIQYLQTRVSAEQRAEFGALVGRAIGQIEGQDFLRHPGIRFPQNGCVACPYLGLCLKNEQLVDSKLVHLEAGHSSDWLDELEV